MKIVRLKTGAACVTLLDEQVIFVDPGLTRDSMITAVRTALPDAHPDAIGHWVEAAMPSTTPLATLQPTRRERRRKDQAGRRGKAVRRAGVNLTSMAAAAALAAGGVTMIQGTGPTPVAAADAWQNPVFNQVEVGSNWDCRGTDSSDLVATCTTPDGTVMHAEAWVGPNSLTFIFSYRDVVTGKQHRNTLKVFSSEGGVQAWLNTRPSEKELFPNLVAGDRWAMYGSDKERLARWAERLGEDVILPADIAEAAFEMGLLPSPQQTDSNVREMAKVPEVVRKTAARILVGDDSLPIPESPPLGGFPGDVPPPAPAPAPTPDEPAPSIPTQPAPTPPPPPPTTEPTPPPATEPSPPPPTTEPTPPPSSEPTPPPSTGEPTQPGDGEEEPVPPGDGEEEPVPPGDGEEGPALPGDDEEEPTPPPSTGEPTPPPSTGEPTSPPSTGEPTRPGDDEEEPTSPPSTDEPTPPGVDREDLEQGSAHQGKPSKVNPLTDPIEVPADEVAPLFDDTLKSVGAKAAEELKAA